MFEIKKRSTHLFFYIIHQIFYNGNYISSTFAGNPMGFRYDFGCLDFEFDRIGNRFAQLLVPPGNKTHGQALFLLSKKAHSPLLLISLEYILRITNPED